MDWCFEMPGVMSEFLGLFTCLGDCRTIKHTSNALEKRAAGILQSYRAFVHLSAPLHCMNEAYCTNSMF